MVFGACCLRKLCLPRRLVGSAHPQHTGASVPALSATTHENAASCIPRSWTPPILTTKRDGRRTGRSCGMPLEGQFMRQIQEDLAGKLGVLALLDLLRGMVADIAIHAAHRKGDHRNGH